MKVVEYINEYVNQYNAWSEKKKKITGEKKRNIHALNERANIKR